MIKRVYKLISVVLAAALLFCMNVTAYAAETLPDGSVKGLPECLVALDDKGQSVSDSGDYFFSVENMQAGETYTKKIQLMNLRDDASYKISFRAEPLTKSGEIDLENECSCEISIDGETVYSGKVTGEGTPDIRDNALSLGNFEPGESHVMKVDVKWNGTSAGGFIDNGERVVTNSGVEITREKSGENYISGETTFKWIFSASVLESEDGTSTVSEITPVSSAPGEDTDYPKSNSASGSDYVNSNSISDFVQTGEVIAFAAIIMIIATSLMLFFLLQSKKKKTRKK